MFLCFFFGLKRNFGYFEQEISPNSHIFSDILVTFQKPKIVYFMQRSRFCSEKESQLAICVFLRRIFERSGCVFRHALVGGGGYSRGTALGEGKIWCKPKVVPIKGYYLGDQLYPTLHWVVSPYHAYLYKKHKSELTFLCGVMNLF